MNITLNQDEIDLALKEIDRAEKRGQGYYDQIGAAISKLMRKGHNIEHAQEVAEAAYDLRN
jgi:hypothetical protein